MRDKSISEDTTIGIFTEHIPSMLGVHELLVKNLKQLRDKGIMKSGIAKVFEKLVRANIPPSPISTAHTFFSYSCRLTLFRVMEFIL